MIALQKDPRRCKNCLLRLRSVIYSTWLVFFKAQGHPGGTCGNLFYALMFALFIALDLLLTVIFMMHVASPLSNLLQFGIPFLLILPGLVLIAPLWCLLAVMQGSTRMLKSYSSMNVCMVLLNYPLTMAWLIWIYDHPYYITVLALLMLNKVPISWFNGKVRANLTWPGHYHF